MSARGRMVTAIHRLYGAVRHPAARTVTAAPGRGGFDELEGHRHCLVVSRRRDGTAVPTPVWCGIADGVLYFRAESVSGKAKRLRRDRAVLVAPCDGRGKPLGAAVAATARILADPDEQAAAEAAIQANFGLGRRFYERWCTMPDGLYVEVIPAPPMTT